MLALSVSLFDSVEGTPSLSVLSTAPGSTVSYVGDTANPDTNLLLVLLNLPPSSMPSGGSGFFVRMEVDDLDLGRALPGTFLGLQTDHFFYARLDRPNGGQTMHRASRPQTAPPWSVRLSGRSSSDDGGFSGAATPIPYSGPLAVGESSTEVIWSSDGTDFVSFPYPGIDSYALGGDHELAFLCSCVPQSGTVFPAHAGTINIYIEAAPTTSAPPHFWTSFVGTRETL